MNDSNHPNRSLDGVMRPQSSPQPEPQEPVRNVPPSLDQGTSPLPDTGAVPLPATPSTDTKSKRSTWKRVAIGGTAIFVALLVLAGLAYWYLQNNILVNNTGDGAASLQENVDPSMLNGEGDGRINILLIGIDSGGGGLADTVMLASFDPIAKDATMIGVPRDLYVNMGEYGSAKINAAHVYGEQFEHEGGGPGLLKETVSQTLDVPVHYYARVDFKGFEQGVDILGGITVDVEESLYDPSFPNDATGGYQLFTIEEGRQEMDGETALKYVRSRKTTSDFDRSRRQQEVLVGARARALSRDILTNPTRIARLMGTLGGNVETDLKVEEIHRLAQLSEEVEEENIVQERLEVSDDNDLLSFSNIHGQSVVVPTVGDFSQVQAHIRSLLVDSYIRDENAAVSILNGTDQPGVAQMTAELLRSYGYNVVNVDNATDQDYTETVLLSYGGGSPYTLRYLENRFGATAQRRSSSATEAEYDIEIVIGSDYVADTYGPHGSY